MPKFPQPIQQLIEQLGMLPGVGPKTAERYAFSVLKRTREERAQLAAAITAADLSLRPCSTCRNYTEHDPCGICSDPRRERALICVVATEQDLLALENTGEYRGVYHVLGGLLSPADGVTPDDLAIRDLAERIRTRPPQEVIIALDATIEGESTTMYLSRALRNASVKITRLARGLPIGSEVGYADEVTLSDALRGRRDVAPPTVPIKVKPEETAVDQNIFSS